MQVIKGGGAALNRVSPRMARTRIFIYFLFHFFFGFQLKREFSLSQGGGIGTGVQRPPFFYQSALFGRRLFGATSSRAGTFINAPTATEPRERFNYTRPTWREGPTRAEEKKNSNFLKNILKGLFLLKLKL